MELHRRSIVKAASYRLVATTLVFVIAFVYTGALTPSVKIGATAAVAKTTLYYLWERLWNRIEWGIGTPPPLRQLPRLTDTFRGTLHSIVLPLLSSTNNEAPTELSQ